jgi:hypothetical protein
MAERRPKARMRNQAVPGDTERRQRAINDFVFPALNNLSSTYCHARHGAGTGVVVHARIFCREQHRLNGLTSFTNHAPVEAWGHEEDGRA